MISIVSRPSKYTTSDNPIIWQIASDNTNIVYFTVQLIQSDSGDIISQLNIFPTPDLPQGSYLNLSRLLSNLVNWQVNNDAFSIVFPMTKPVCSYRLNITEQVVSDSTITSGSTSNDISEVNYVFNGRLDRVSADAYNQNDYLITSDSDAAKFLTTKPNFSYINDDSAEFLYFIQDKSVAGLQVKIKTFNAASQIVSTYFQDIQDIDIYTMFRLNISPKALQLSMGANFTGIAYYTVTLMEGQTLRSEAKTFIYGQRDCSMEYLNFLWVNNLGGLDSYQFLNPQETVSVADKFSIKKNIYGISDGKYSDISGGVYNASDVIINNTPTGTVAVITSPLSDQESYWLATLVESKQVFLELPNYQLIPVTLNNSSYLIPRNKYTKGQLNYSSFEFTLADGVLPSAVGAFGDKSDIAVIYNSEARTQNFTKNDCPAHQFGSVVPFTIAAGAYHSTISVAEANRKRDEHFNQDGQDNANAVGSCMTQVQVGNDYMQQSFTRNNCPAGQIGSVVLITVAANTYFAADKAAANQLALAYITANGQSNANQSGTCTPLNNFYVNDVWYGSFGNACDGEAIYVNSFEITRVSDNALIYTYNSNHSTSSTSGFIPGLVAGVVYKLNATVMANMTKTKGISAVYLTGNSTSQTFSNFGAQNNVTSSINFTAGSTNNISVGVSSKGTKC